MTDIEISHEIRIVEKMSMIKTFYFRGEKATPQKCITHPKAVDVGGADFEISNRNYYFLITDSNFKVPLSPFTGREIKFCGAAFSPQK